MITGAIMLNKSTFAISLAMTAALLTLFFNNKKNTPCDTVSIFLYTLWHNMSYKSLQNNHSEAKKY